MSSMYSFTDTNQSTTDSELKKQQGENQGGKI